MKDPSTFQHVTCNIGNSKEDSTDQMPSQEMNSHEISNSHVVEEKQPYFVFASSDSTIRKAEQAHVFLLDACTLFCRNWGNKWKRSIIGTLVATFRFGQKDCPNLGRQKGQCIM